MALKPSLAVYSADEFATAVDCVVAAIPAHYDSTLAPVVLISWQGVCCVSVPAPTAVVGENHMPDGLAWRERLERAHKQMQEAMTELITNKNYSEAERLLHFVDKLMLDLIEDMGGSVVRSGLWT